MPSRSPWPFFLLIGLGVLLFIVHLSVGSVDIGSIAVIRALFSPSQVPVEDAAVVRGIRLPQAITAIVSGSGLAASGLLMQTLFRNPLAGPSILGITSGASLGVALVLLAAPVIGMAIAPDLLIMIAAFIGSSAVLLLILLADRRVGDGITLLIIGLMIGYLCSAIISVLQATSDASALKGYVHWGMGSFAGVGLQRLGWLAWPVLLGVVLAFLMMKPLNALLLGDENAAALGVKVPFARQAIMVITALLAGTITAFCGPIAFLGLATPHVARGIFRTNDHTRLLPATVLSGGVLALACDIVVRSPEMGASIPLNAVTSLLGAPVVAWVLFSGKRWARA